MTKATVQTFENLDELIVKVTEVFPNAEVAEDHETGEISIWPRLVTDENGKIVNYDPIP